MPTPLRGCTAAVAFVIACLTWAGAAYANPSGGEGKTKRVTVSDGRVTEQAFPDDQAPPLPPEQRGETVCGGNLRLFARRDLAQGQAYITCNKPSIVSGTLRVQEYIRQDKEWATIGHDTVKADHTPTAFLAYGACTTGFLIRATLNWTAVTPNGGIGPRTDTTDPDACR
jgi:hypothetical protein